MKLERRKTMSTPKFVYVTYIAGNADQVWNALLDVKFTRKYWGRENVSDWKKGSNWEHRRLDDTHTVDLVGEVIESVPPHRLALTWAEPADKANKAKHTRVTLELQPIESMVRLTVTHDQFENAPEMLPHISEGWPRVLSSLKSLLETGKPLHTWAKSQNGVTRVMEMENSGEILRQFYVAVQEKDLVAARKYLSDDLVFVGVFETYPNAEAYIASLTKLLQIVKRLSVKSIVAEGSDAAIFFELETIVPAAATTLVAEWHQIKNGKIVRVHSAFDGRPFADMFGGAGASSAKTISKTTSNAAAASRAA
jgi:uncharacterized protein YndB with AHSA1/START domain